MKILGQKIFDRIFISVTRLLYALLYFVIDFVLDFFLEMEMRSGIPATKLQISSYQGNQKLINQFKYL